MEQCPEIEIVPIEALFAAFADKGKRPPLGLYTDKGKRPLLPLTVGPKGRLAAKAANGGPKGPTQTSPWKARFLQGINGVPKRHSNKCTPAQSTHRPGGNRWPTPAL